MGSIKAGNHSFIIRIWREEYTGQDNRPAWRGHITHVPSGMRKYFKQLDEIASFVSIYLEELDADEKKGEE